MDLGLRGKSVLVTGGSRGIGRAAAEAFAAAGCALHLAARSAEDLQRAADELRSSYQVSVTTHPGDLRKLAGAMTLAKACRDVDILVNNAGATPTGPIENVTDADWREGLDLKVIATVNLTRELYMAMCARRSGVIVNVIGNCGERPDPEIIIGTIANAGLMGFTRALGSVSPDHGVRVLGVNPGPTATERLVSARAGMENAATGTVERRESRTVRIASIDQRRRAMAGILSGANWLPAGPTEKRRGAVTWRRSRRAAPALWGSAGCRAR